MNTIKLSAPKGTDDANLGGRIFHPHDDGLFHIDADLDITPLLHVGGFSLADDAPVAPVAEPGPTTIDDVEALARKLPIGETRARLLGAIAAVVTSEPRRTVRLIPPSGTTGFSHGSEHFEAEDDGTILAPIEAVDSLTTVAGFAFAPDDPPPSPLAEDETPAADTCEVTSIEPAASVPAVEVAAPAAPSIPRLVIPNPVAA
jgi:hypothetical protein